MKILALLLLSALSLRAADVFVEVESFADHGGWKLDTQFIDEMGSPYLLAHGLGNPVANAKGKVSFGATGTYHIWVRTKDWTARWDAEGSPGQFKVKVNGNEVLTTFGTVGKDWHWQYGGSVLVNSLEAEIVLHDLTGFNGRCDAIYFNDEEFAPPNDDCRTLRVASGEAQAPEKPAR